MEPMLSRGFPRRDEKGHRSPSGPDFQRSGRLRIVIAAALVAGLSFVTIEAVALVAGLPFVTVRTIGVGSNALLQLFDIQTNFRILFHLFHLLSLKRCVENSITTACSQPENARGKVGGLPSLGFMPRASSV